MDASALQRVMDRVREGDVKALDTLVGLLWAPLVRYASLILPSTRSTEEASDVVQTCFIRLWERRGERRESGSVRALLYRMVRNQAFDERRRMKRRRRVLLEIGRAEPPRPPRPDEELAERELRAALRRAFADLSPRRREIFLAHLHGFSYREIANVLGISPQTAANQLCSALGSLRTAVGATLGDAEAPDAGAAGGRGPDRAPVGNR